MSDSDSSPIFMFGDGDFEMQAAYESARASFRYFWREMAWEMRRIVPALDMACVKAPFEDDEVEDEASDDPEVEQMWIGEVDFDGQYVVGELLNQPNWLTGFDAGDHVGVPLDHISDWMYVVDGEVYGAYTVNLMRSRMSKQERREHDEAWGLDFGDPKSIRIVPQKKGWFDRKTAESAEHPMSESMAEQFRSDLAEDASIVNETDEDGWTLLHQLSLAGSTANVQVLLEYGADANAITEDGKTPIQLARSLGWESVIALLQKHGATE